MGERRVGPVGAAAKYRLVERRASGGEGELWRARYTGTALDIDVAVKILHTKNADRDFAVWLRRWNDQVELLRTLEHRSILRVREVFVSEAVDQGGSDAAGRVGDVLCLVMNWVDGVELSRWASEPGRDVGSTLAVLRLVAEAIDYLHGDPVGRKPVIHRDIKPGNILVRPDAVPVLVDFGFTRLGLDDAMTVVGTPGYWAPEAYGANPRFTPASDRYAFGCTVAATLLGVGPAGIGPDDLAARVRERVEASSRDFVDRFLVMLSPDPTSRPSSCLAWFDELFGDRADGTTVVPPDPAPATRPDAWSAPTVPSQPTPVPDGAPAATRSPMTPFGRRGRVIAIAAVGSMIAAGAFALRPGGSSGDAGRYLRADGVIAVGPTSCTGLAGLCIAQRVAEAKRTLGEPKVERTASLSWVVDGTIVYADVEAGLLQSVKVYWDEERSSRVSVALPAWVTGLAALAPDTDVAALVRALGRPPDAVASDGPDRLALTWRYGSGQVAFGATSDGTTNAGSPADVVQRHGDQTVLEVLVSS